jgi:predicted nucleic acid-binding protein
LERRYRFAGPCVTSKCGFWTGERCGLGAKLVESYQDTGGPALDAVTAGTIAICDPVELEFLRDTAANTRRPQIQRLLHSTYAWAPVPDDCWERALEVQDQLGATGQHSGASVADLLVAVTAMRNRLILLHDDRDYEVIAKVTNLRTARVMQTQGPV